MAQVFISYRRSDTTSGYASWIYDRLAGVFGDDRVFMDVDSLPIGVDFVDHLNRALTGADVALILIGPGWLGAIDKTGARRLDDPEDLVRIEIATALSKCFLVIPVLVDGAQLPDAGELPEDLRALKRRQALVFERRGDAAINELIAAIERAALDREHARHQAEPTARARADGDAVSPASPAAQEQVPPKAGEAVTRNADDPQIAEMWERAQQDRRRRLTLLNLGLARAAIAADEPVSILSWGRQGMTAGLLAVTDRRVLFFSESRFKHEFRVQEWDLRTVPGAASERETSRSWPPGRG